MLIICPRCKRENRVSNKYCGVCGLPLSFSEHTVTTQDLQMRLGERLASYKEGRIYTQEDKELDQEIFDFFTIIDTQHLFDKFS